MDAITQLVLIITLAAVALYALYWVVRKAIRDELHSPRRNNEASNASPDAQDSTSDEPGD